VAVAGVDITGVGIADVGIADVDIAGVGIAKECVASGDGVTRGEEVTGVGAGEGVDSAAALSSVISERKIRIERASERALSGSRFAPNRSRKIPAMISRCHGSSAFTAISLPEGAWGCGGNRVGLAATRGGDKADSPTRSRHGSGENRVRP
jgi:hypothetical protein